MEYLKAQGFRISSMYHVCNTPEEVWQAVLQIGTGREALEYDIDGAVIKTNLFTQREMLGSTSKFPRWATAYKYPPEKKFTRLKEIEINVGRTGVLTPLALLDPVFLAGSTISKATLHNMDYIEDRDIRIGDMVQRRERKNGKSCHGPHFKCRNNVRNAAAQWYEKKERRLIAAKIPTVLLKYIKDLFILPQKTQ